MSITIASLPAAFLLVGGIFGVVGAQAVGWAFVIGAALAMIVGAR